MWGVASASGLTAQKAVEPLILTPERRDVPAFPEECRPNGDGAQSDQRVWVMFGVDEEGATQDIRVRESTEPCFEAAAAGAVEGWRYKPLIVNGVARARGELEAMFTFRPQGATEAVDADASPLHRAPPFYPEKCFARAKPREYVLVGYDVTVEGRTENVRTIESSSKCFHANAIAAVKKWIYAPAVVDGAPAPRLNMQTTVTFENG